MSVLSKKAISVKEPKVLKSQPGDCIKKMITQSFSKIAPFWPLKNLIAVNPMAGFEDIPFEQALKEAKAFFQQPDLPIKMQEVNRHSIKWLQVFFDEGQSCIPIPHKEQGFMNCVLSLLPYDDTLFSTNSGKLLWLKSLPKKPEKIIAECLFYLGIAANEQETFLTLMLTTLSGWAAHICYRSQWCEQQPITPISKHLEAEYLAFRLILTCLLWPKAKQLLTWHQKALATAQIDESFQALENQEKTFQSNLIQNLCQRIKPEKLSKPKAQFVFCIDVRSEPFRRALEAQGDYQTYGFAGFFGVPIRVENAISGKSHSSCPVLLKPSHHILEDAPTHHTALKRAHKILLTAKRIYQSLKYNFTTPFSLVEAMGLLSAAWMGLKCWAPSGTHMLKTTTCPDIHQEPSLMPLINSIPLAQQVTFAANALNMIGLTENFSALVIFCGHGSSSENNAYASSLDCGACGGNQGAPNAKVLASILNDTRVRQALKEKSILIPCETLFIAALHNTTTDTVVLFDEQNQPSKTTEIQHIKRSLQKAKELNNQWRSQQLNLNQYQIKAHDHVAKRAQDWSQVRPEWGLAKNAAFLIGPRWLSKSTPLDGRAFLHSYEWHKDIKGQVLETILTAPLIVAQWINAQYLFSTMDNIAYGSGSKITHNITGKMGIMQGNASDLMHGLPLQSLFHTDDQPYHIPLRLTAVVYAPRTSIDRIVATHQKLQHLLANGWIHLICIDPKMNQTFKLKRSLNWQSL